jgi:cytochrome P450
VADTVNKNLDEVIGTGHMELQSTISFPMALATTGNLIGIPPEELQDFRTAVESWEKLALAYISGMSLDDQMVLARQVMSIHLRINELLEERRRNPKEDLLSDLVAPGVSDGLTPKELLSLIPGLFFAGNQTTSDALGLGIYHLLAQRGRYAELVSDPSRAPLFVEEILRLDGPVFGLWRHVLQDTTIGDAAVPAGAKLFVSFWFANLDNSHFTLAQDFDITRQHPKTHLSFGRGIHYCIGAPLGRLELGIALETIARRLPGLNLSPGFTPSWKPHFFLRGIDELQLVW